MNTSAWMLVASRPDKPDRYGHLQNLLVGINGEYFLPTLFALSQKTGHKMPLTLPDGRTSTVIFDRTEGTAIEAQQIFSLSAPADRSFYTVVVRVMTVMP